MSGVLRSVKNVTKGYSAVQVKVRNATSNAPWGPTGTDMADIAKITFNSSTDFYEVMDMLDKRLNDKGKNWRHVLKSLKVLDYCLHEGSELVVTWARKNIYIIKTLREFMHTDDDGRDVGASIRASAKELTSLVLDEERLRAERANRGSWKSRVTGLEEFGLGGEDPSSSLNTPRRHRQQRPQRDDEDDLEYRLALEASKNEAEMEAQRRKGGHAEETDDDLAKAIKLSKEEEEARKRQLEDQTQSDLLFDDTPVQAPQPTGFNQGYQQQAAVDWFGNPVQQQQTGYVENAYSQPTGLQPQQTAFQNGYGNNFGYQQPQPTGYEQMQQPQAQFLQPQNTYNPWAQQMNNGFSQQSQQQQQPIQEQPTAAGSNNPWASTQPAASPIGIQPTGSNNPFASQPQRQATASPFRSQPTLSSLAEQQASNQFNARPNPIQNFTAPQPQPPLQPQQTAKQQAPVDPYQAKLNHLLSTGEGQDTFGNIGDMRIPAQHTAPGTYVNSAGLGSMGRLEASRTGNNPFFNQHSQPQPQMPAQTGPAGGFGGNPFGAQPQQQQQQGYGGQQPGQGGSLIDL
ncbi:related to EH domain binding protein epsin 2 [Ramularia collo-cygni]|uniref:Related to EH domain binding protein epsin 2 n=1 Tax=Ramularia collo-cygni TaxID=112498 RepID=A0A2D3VPS6_9PEZI|nr:related to EH domain binding protein epsin 2 [Ramularia collo-cygni]CZT24008.1 related to EH domain binding protein epsin 2 [Ramularia collo-cygni]